MAIFISNRIHTRLHGDEGHSCNYPFISCRLSGVLGSQDGQFYTLTYNEIKIHVTADTFRTATVGDIYKSPKYITSSAIILTL